MKAQSKDFVLLVGGSGDIGSSIIETLLQSGLNVLYTYYNREPKDISACEGTLLSYQMDVRNEEDVVKLEEYISSNNIKVKGLIYNAGITKDNLFENMSIEDFAETIDVNLMGCVRVCKHFMNSIAVNAGSVVIVSSISGLIGKAGQANYSASKAALVSLTRTLAMEYAIMGARVNAVAPGLIETDMTRAIDKQVKKGLLKTVPMRRIGKPREIANVVKFLISSESSYVTGQTIVADGGIVMG